MKAKTAANAQSTLADLPSREQLALMAAATHCKSSAEAVEQALAIGRKTGSALRPASERVWVPKSFPAKLCDFLRRIVRAKNRAEGRDRFVDFYRNFYKPSLPVGGELSDEDKKDTEDLACFTVMQWEDEGFEGEDAKWHWQWLAREYLDWWKTQKSEKARESAKSRKPALKLAESPSKLPLPVSPKKHRVQDKKVAGLAGTEFAEVSFIFFWLYCIVAIQCFT